MYFFAMMPPNSRLELAYQLSVSQAQSFSGRLLVSGKMRLVGLTSCTIVNKRVAKCLKVWEKRRREKIVEFQCQI
jgi:hypothetical protein